MLCVTWLVMLTSIVPKKDAPFPQISKIPKYSPACSCGMILAKYERDNACTPPWNSPTQTARIQNFGWESSVMPKTVISVYAAMQTEISMRGEYLPDSLPNNSVAGNATICVTKSASKSPVVSRPSAVPYAVAISIIVYTPSI